MAKEKCAAKPDKGEREETTTVIMTRSLAAVVRKIADHHDITMIEVWEKWGRPAIVREYKRIIDREYRELGGEGG